ncbi:MAG: FAD-dependent oxidoreductase [Acidimicrobiales bacterium]
METVHRDVVVVGGGIIGLTSAFRLAVAHHRVTVFDPSPARGATWAAAGMIAPSGEIGPGEEANYELEKKALQSWREVGHLLEALTGESLVFGETGTLLVGWDASDRRQLEQFVEIAASFEAPMTRVLRNDSPDVFQGLSPRITSGVLMAGDAWLDPDQVVRLLLEALAKLGAQIVNERVLRVRSEGGAVIVNTQDQEFHADLGLLATGALGLPEGATSLTNSVRPIRGATVRVQGVDRSLQPSVRAFVRGRAFYMVSRPGGYCVLGASADERADAVLEVGELQRLLRDGLDVVPELESATVLETRIGLRPASPTLEPFFERLTLSGWAWSSGHYRHGVTLAPLAALAAVEFVETSA